MKKKAITICFILSFLISSLSFFFFQANVLATNDLESKYSTINDADNLYDSVPYWFNASLYDPDDLTRDFQSGLLSIEKEGSFGIKENFTLLNDFNNNYWDNLTEFNPTFTNGSYSDGVFHSSNISFNYDYGFHPSTNYNETLYNQMFTAPDGSMSHNYQPEDLGYNSSYSVDGNLTMYNEFPNEKYWEFWNSYNYSYDPLYTTSTFNRYNYVTNASVQSGNGDYISGDEEDLKYADSLYFKAKSVDYLGDEILYIDFDFSTNYNWDDLDGDYFLFFQSNDTMNFRDKNHQELWSGKEAGGILLTDIDDYMYIYDERASSFSIQIDYLFLLDPKLISQLNYHVENVVPNQTNDFTFINGSFDGSHPPYGDLWYVDGNYTLLNSTTQASSETYPATYTFTDDADGSNPAGWVITESGGSIQVVSSWQDHTKVLQNHHTSYGYQHARAWFTARKTGTIEWWGGQSTNSISSYYVIHDGSGNIGVEIYFLDTGYIAYYDGSYHNIQTYSADTWYHFRVEFDADSSYWHLWINKIKKSGSGYNYRDNPGNFDNFGAQFFNPGGTIDQYTDAVDFSWESGYYTNRNYDPLPGEDAVLNFTILTQFDIPTPYSNDTIDYFRLYYSYNTSINYQGINFSIWNFDTSQYDIINNSEINDNFYDLFFNINSSYYNSTGHFILKFDLTNSSNSVQIYLDKLKIEFKWTKTSGNIEASLTKSIVFDFLNYYDSFDNYLKLYRFDYIFNYRFTNTSNHARSAKFNAQNLNTDGSWHIADFYDIYDSSTGDGTINLEFLITNGILEIRTFQYSMWFGCVNLTGDRRILQQIFGVEFPNEGDLSEYVKTNGMFLININYSFSTEVDGYDYTNTYGRHNKLEIHYAFKADGAWYYAMDSMNSSITKNRLINITDIMNGLGLSDFEDFAITFVMIGNSSQITVFNVSLWDTRAVVPAFLNFTFDHEFTRDYLLNYFELLYDWNTTAYTLINFSIYDFQNNTYNLLKSDINTEGDSLYSFVSYLFNYYQDSDNKTHAWVISDYNYSTAFSLNLSINFNYRTSIWVSHKLTFDERGVWRYRFVLTSSGGEYSTEWVYFDVIEPVPNFQAVSKSDYITNWILMSNDTASNIVTRFSDDLIGDQWELTGVPNRYVWYEVYPSGDSWVDLDNPSVNHGSETELKVSDTIYYTYIEDIHVPEDESDYFVDNVTGRDYSNFRFYGISGTGNGNLYFTTDFDEHTITWNNKPALGGSIGWAIPLGSGWRQFYNIPYTNPGRYVFTSNQPPGSYQKFYSKESGSNKPYFRHYVSKNYHDTSSGYFYMQTNTDETLSMISSVFSTTQAYANDFVLIDCQTLNSDLDVIFLKNGGVVKTLPLVRDNTNYYRRSIEVLIDEDISFDQIKISGQFSDKEYFKCYDIKIQGYEFEEQQNIVQFGVAPDSSATVFVLSGENILKIYDNGILRLEKTIILTYDEVYIEEYVGLVLETVYFSYYDVNNEPLGFDYFKVYVNYTIDNRTILNEQLFDNFLFVDDESTINFNVYDTFNILIASIEEPETTFIKIVLNIYSLKIKNEAVEPVSYILKNPESSIEKSSNIFPDEIIEFKISSGNYIFDYINGEDNALRALNFTLNDNKIVVINSTYYQLYVSCFNFDGLGLDTDWVRLYINNLRKDFGFNTMKYECTRFVVLDYFNASLADETVYTKVYTEYNIYVQVYNLILNNNYSHSIYIEITRPDVDISVKQVIPAQSGINYRFLPKVDYIISYYHINGTKIGDKRITLDSNNQIVSFGFYSEEVPPVPIDEIVKYENSMFLDIIVIVLCFTIVIAAILYFYRKLYKKNKQQQQYIYNQNINKKKLKIDGLFGK